MRCPDQFELQSYLDKELDPRREMVIRRHVAQCLECRVTLSELNEVVSLLQEAIPVVPCPQVNTPKRISPLRKATMAAAAVLLLVLTVSGFWVYNNDQTARDWSPETELMDQYITIFSEDIANS